MRISGTVDVNDIDAWEVRYRGVALELVIDEIFKKLGLAIKVDISGPIENIHNVIVELEKGETK